MSANKTIKALREERNQLYAEIRRLQGLAGEEPTIREMARDARAGIKAEPSAPKCKTCNGTGMVDDGEITCSEGGIPYENGPVKCVKDCPDCAPKCAYCGDTGQIMVGRSGDANDGNAPIMEPCEDCDGTGSSGGQMHSNGVDAPEFEPFKCDTCSGFGIVGNILNAETCTDCTPSAPVERDERAEFDAAYERGDFYLAESRSEVQYQDYRKQQAWAVWQVRAALGRKPSDDIPDFTPGNGNKAERRATALVAQLQADLTERDEEIDRWRMYCGAWEAAAKSSNIVESILKAIADGSKVAFLTYPITLEALDAMERPVHLFPCKDGKGVMSVSPLRIEP